MKIEVRLFGSFQKHLPKKESSKYSCDLELNGSASLADVLHELGIPVEQPKVILINGVIGKNGDLLKEKDILSIISPVSGG